MILIACEESQTVCKAFRDLGHEAYSCDIEPAGNPEYHLQCDVSEILKLKWDLVIAFPPCTHLSVSGAKWFEAKKKDGRQKQGIDFFMQFVDCAPMVAIENPVGIMSSYWRRPDQRVQPWMFGDPFQKTTCLWLKNLPLLVPTDIVDKGEIGLYKGGVRMPEWYANAKHSERSRIRSKTFPGIAAAMASQWGSLLPVSVRGENAISA